MPPAHRQRARRSARLNAHTPSHLGAMDEESNIQGHSTSHPPLEQSGPWLAIQWHHDRALTDTLKAMAAADDGPSGSDKGQIYSVLTKLIFTDHVKGKYKQIKVSFSSTGAGVMPVEGTSAKNLLDAALLKLPWYTELDAIWHSNPSMAAKVHLSRPGVNHTGAFYSLVQPHGGAGPSMYYGDSQRSSHTPDVSDHPSAYQHGHHMPQTFAGGMYPPVTHDYSTLRHSTPPPPLPSHSPSHLHLPGLPPDDGDNIADNIMMLDNGPGSPSPVAGKKQQLPSSPSPPASPAPELFVVPSRTPASMYNNRCRDSRLSMPDIQPYYPFNSLHVSAHIQRTSHLCSRVRALQTVKPWGAPQNTIGHITQHINALIDDTQHHFIVILSYIPHAPDDTSKKCQQLDEEKGEVGHIAAGGAGEG
ncbi:uncharacterized protein HD556DRAFT_1451116 [Suillus plorans]|uniref:Uncharacterized protein n=1 Tax=Suillus plorans TaxID=116603 RepID=A0A9P7A9L1_9AGAM|nr:uncharacterized protein HD556DRAFT_1451116 [Suillus plorans]KAG1785029.1 hypothetical protein HD556DRAFT_1451116 [Suillus plorans]